MKKIILFTLIAFLSFSVHTQTTLFNSLLQTHVTKNGNVDYKSFKTDEAKLDKYLNYLATTSPKKNWSAAKTKAFWVNVYNAYTIKLILEHYPINSIRKIKKKGKDAWNIPFAKVGNKIHTLNHIEHEILRKDFDDPKIHVAVNCASVSCPQLGNFAFTEKNYEAKTEKLMKKFINDPKRNKLTANKLQLSKIFEWFQEDFTKQGSLVEFLSKYTTIKINDDAKIQYLEYNWNLNGK